MKHYVGAGLALVGLFCLTFVRAWLIVGVGQAIFMYVFFVSVGINEFSKGWIAMAAHLSDTALEERLLTKASELRTRYDDAIAALEKLLAAPVAASEHCYNTSHDYAIQEDCVDCRSEHAAWLQLEEARAAARAALDKARKPLAPGPAAPSRAEDIPDPGKQALQMLQRGDDCDWYSIKHSDEMHEAFDCLEIYWRTEVRKPTEEEMPYHRFESRAGFRVRWHVSATHTSYCEAYGLDLMTTILEAREIADRQRLRAMIAKRMDHKHPALEAWKSREPEREYSFHGLDLEKWSVRLDYPGGLAWSDHAELEQAVVDALAKAPA